MKPILQSRTILVFITIFSAAFAIAPWGTLTWTPAETFKQSNQEPGGYSKKTGAFKFIGRLEIPLEGSFVGYYLPAKRTLHYGKDGEMQTTTVDQAKENGQGIFILTYPPGTVSWVIGGCGSGSPAASKRKLPANLVVGGLMPSSSDQIFVCRANQDGNVGIGYFTLSNKRVCSVTFGKSIFDLTKHVGPNNWGV